MIDSDANKIVASGVKSARCVRQGRTDVTAEPTMNSNKCLIHVIGSRGVDYGLRAPCGVVLEQTE